MLYFEEKWQNRGKNPYNIPIYYDIFPILPYFSKKWPYEMPYFGVKRHLKAWSCHPWLTMLLQSGTLQKTGRSELHYSKGLDLII